MVVIKLHMMFAALSLGLFLLRAVWSVRSSPWLQRRWVKVLPHLVDTLLLACGLVLMILLHAWPHKTPWLAAKLLALLVYIGVGTVAIKRGRSPASRAFSAALAVLVFVYMVMVAVTKNPMPFPFLI